MVQKGMQQKELKITRFYWKYLIVLYFLVGKALLFVRIGMKR